MASVGVWESVWEDTYQQDGVVRPVLRHAGLGEFVHRRGLHRRGDAGWVQSTVDRLLPLVRDRGCWRSAPARDAAVARWRHASARYVATDFSPTVVARLPDLVAEAGLAERVKVLPLSADQISPESMGLELPAAGFEVVVAQFGTAVLPRPRLRVAEVIGRAGATWSPLMARSSSGTSATCGCTSFSRSGSSTACISVRATGRGRRSRTRRAEAAGPGPAAASTPSCCSTPHFFTAVPARATSRRCPRSGRSATEMNDFRYDVVISRRPPRSLEEWVDWSTIGSLAALEDRLTELAATAHGGLGVRRVPNARLVSDQAGLAELARGRLPELSTALAGVHPDDLWELGERHGLHVELSVLEDAGSLAAAFTVEPGPVAFPAYDTSGPDASDPVAARARTRLRAETARAVTEVARARLPEYMVPAAVHALPEPAAQAQRQARPLGPAGAVRVSGGDAVRRTAPHRRSSASCSILWAELLGIDDFGVEDDFFRLGGHSLLAVRMLAAVARGLGVSAARCARSSRLRRSRRLAAEIEAADPRRRGRRRLSSRSTGPHGADALRRLHDPEVLAEALAGSGRRTPTPTPPSSRCPAAQERMWFLDAAGGGPTDLHGAPLVPGQRPGPHRRPRRGARVAGGAARQPAHHRPSPRRGAGRRRRRRGRLAAADRRRLRARPIPKGLPGDHSREVASGPSTSSRVRWPRRTGTSWGRTTRVFVAAPAPCARRRLGPRRADGRAAARCTTPLGVGGSPRPAATLQYPDFVVWQEQLDDDAHIRARPRLLARPAGRRPVGPRAADRPTRGRRAARAPASGSPWRWAPPLTEQIRALAREHAHHAVRGAAGRHCRAAVAAVRPGRRGRGHRGRRAATGPRWSTPSDCSPTPCCSGPTRPATPASSTCWRSARARSPRPRTTRTCPSSGWSRS